MKRRVLTAAVFAAVCLLQTGCVVAAFNDFSEDDDALSVNGKDWKDWSNAQTNRRVDKQEKRLAEIEKRIDGLQKRRMAAAPETE